MIDLLLYTLVSCFGLQNISHLFQRIARDFLSVFTHEKVYTVLDFVFALPFVVLFVCSQYGVNIPRQTAL